MTNKPTTNQLPTVKYEDAVAATREYFAGDELAATVWVSKYALKDSYGNIFESTPVDMHNRIAAELARIESNSTIEVQRLKQSPIPANIHIS